MVPLSKAELGCRIAIVEANLAACTLCPWRCGVDRLSGPAGYCGLGSEGRVFHHYLSLSEEEVISPTYEVFLTGCSHRCRFCYVLDRVVDPSRGRVGSEDELAAALERARLQGLRTLSFVGGEPTVNLLAILRLIERLEPPEPIVWNTNLFISEEAHRVLDGLVTWVVGDLHWGNDRCAARIGQVRPYFETAARSALRAAGYARLIVRHLFMPGHRRCCFEPIALWLAEHMRSTPFHLLDNYQPNPPLTRGSLAKHPAIQDIEDARRFAHSLGLEIVS